MTDNLLEALNEPRITRLRRCYGGQAPIARIRLRHEDQVYRVRQLRASAAGVSIHRLSVGHKPSILNKIKDYLLDNLCCKRLENLNEPTKIMNLNHR